MIGMATPTNLLITRLIVTADVNSLCVSRVLTHCRAPVKAFCAAPDLFANDPTQTKRYEWKDSYPESWS
jgi:hypothetical protein